MVLETAIAIGLGLVAIYAAIDQFRADRTMLMLDISSAWSLIFLPFGALGAAIVIVLAPSLDTSACP